MTKYISEYSDEFHRTLNKICENIEKRKNPKLNPYTISHQIIDLVKGLETNEHKAKAMVSISDRIRKFHDFYGWMAKGTPAGLGVCSGTFYRSLDYLSIPPIDRSGKKIDKYNEFGVHVEHSIPVKVLRNLLISNIDAGSKPEEVFDYLVTYSLCTGFSRINERRSIKHGCGSTHLDFDESGAAPRPVSVKPFVRYNSDVEIYSILSGRKVELTENLHTLNFVMKNMDIFSWSFLERNYQ
jgi:hypothetical protein